MAKPWAGPPAHGLGGCKLRSAVESELASTLQARFKPAGSLVFVWVRTQCSTGTSKDWVRCQAFLRQAPPTWFSSTVVPESRGTDRDAFRIIQGAGGDALKVGIDCIVAVIWLARVAVVGGSEALLWAVPSVHGVGLSGFPHPKGIKRLGQRK